MDNNNFEQQFTQNIKATPTQAMGASVDASGNGGGSRLPLIIALALGAITFVESIVLMITLVNYFSYVNEDYNPEEDTYVDDAVDDGDYKYDVDDNLIAFNETCRGENGSYYSFGSDNKYQFFDSSSNPTDSGTYTLIREAVVTLNGNSQNKTLYYGGGFIADGTVIYDCEETSTTSEE